MALAAMAVLPAAGMAAEASTQQVITSPGPLTSVTVTDQLACQAQYADDQAFEFFPGVGPLGACGTFVAVDGERGTVYGPDVPSGKDVTAYTPVGQSPVTGSGSDADPFTLTTVVDLGSTGLRLTEVDRYVTGDQSYRTDMAIANRSSGTRSVTLYHAADCYLENNDGGYGLVDIFTGGVFCAANANNDPPGRIEGLVPLSSGSHHIEGFYGTVWSALNGSSFPDSCECAVLQDNGVGLSWTLDIPALSTATRSLTSAFSPTGVIADMAPETEITGGVPDGGGTGVTTPAFAFASNKGGSTFECRVDADAFAPCASPYATRSLAPGTHTFEVRAKDASGNIDPSPARRTFKVVQTTIVGLESTTQRDPTFEFTTSESSATFECRVDGDAFALCASPFTVSPLAQGSHVFEVRVRDKSGNIVGSARLVFEVLDPPPPVRGETVNAFVTSGKVRIRLPGHKKGETLRKPRHLPVGTEFDTTRGHLRLDSASDAKGHKVQSAAISAGKFVVRQKHGSKRATLGLLGPVGPCPSAKAGTATSSKAKRRAKRKRRHLWVKTHGKGTYTTSGKYGSGSVRGTQWFTEDRCDGTLVSVKRGVVAVRDFAKHRTVRVKKGHHYLARKP